LFDAALDSRVKKKTETEKNKRGEKIRLATDMTCWGERGGKQRVSELQMSKKITRGPALCRGAAQFFEEGVVWDPELKRVGKGKRMGGLGLANGWEGHRGVTIDKRITCLLLGFFKRASGGMVGRRKEFKPGAGEKGVGTLFELDHKAGRWGPQPEGQGSVTEKGKGGGIMPADDANDIEKKLLLIDGKRLFVDDRGVR